MIFDRAELGLNFETLRSISSNPGLAGEDDLGIFSNRQKSGDIYTR